MTHEYLKKGRVSDDNRKFHKMTVAGRYRLGIRRSLGYAGANATLQILNVAVGPKAVLDSEKLYRANVFVRNKGWCPDSERGLH